MKRADLSCAGHGKNKLDDEKYEYKAYIVNSTVGIQAAFDPLKTTIATGDLARVSKEICKRRAQSHRDSRQSSTDVGKH